MNTSSPESSDISSVDYEKQSPVEDRAKMSPAFHLFQEKMTSLPTYEEKIAHGLQFMKGSISQEGSPRFREFWEARREILPSFKENLNPAIRSKLWGEYVELTVEARRLKDILEEQSAFAMEQIDLAVKSIEGDLSNLDTLLSQMGDIAFPASSETISEKLALYAKLQKELNLLNTLASRLNGLRKEIIKTDMRIRFKTKFFKRLSELGDQIFPKRKDLIEKVSSEFEKDIERFIGKYFQGDTVTGAPYYAMREEIKSLQAIAKILTLNSSVFNRTRLSLSQCWDRIKVLEKEHKKEVFEKKQASSEQRQGVQTRIEELKAKTPELPLRDLDKEIDDIVKDMRAISLHRDDVRFLRDELSKLRTPYLAAQEQKARELEESEKEKLRIKKEKVTQIKEEVAQLTKDGAQLELEVLLARFSDLLQSIEQLEASKIEKQQMERSLRSLKDLVADRKEHSLLNLSDDDLKTLENLRTVLAQKKQRRQEIKEQLEMHRKALGSSNLDFEKAMLYRELLEQEKERLDKANGAIEEIEQKISDLESH
jgi:DNA repair exonuclease SbcCD ATPase subunit